MVIIFLLQQRNADPVLPYGAGHVLSCMGCRFGSRCGRSSPPHSVSGFVKCLLYACGLRLPFWTSLPLASLSAANALISGFCSSGYDFAILSSCLHLTMQTLGVAMEFVGNYAPCRLSPQTDGMPVIPKKDGANQDTILFCIRIYSLYWIYFLFLL